MSKEQESSFDSQPFQDNRLLRQTTDWIDSSIPDRMVPLTCRVLIMEPLSRFALHFGALLNGNPQSEVERFYNVSILCTFRERGEAWLKKTGRLEKWGGMERRPTIKEAAETLSKSPSLALRQAVQNAPPLPSSDGEISSTEASELGLNLGPPFYNNNRLAPKLNLIKALPLEEFLQGTDEGKELAERNRSLGAVASQIFDFEDKRKKFGSDVLRTQAAQLVKKIFSHSPFRTEPLSTLPHETRALLLFYYVLSTIEVSPPVLTAAVEAGEAILDHWFELVRSEAELVEKGGTEAILEQKPEEISFQEAELAAKTLISIGFRTIPEARERAREAATKIIQRESRLKNKLWLNKQTRPVLQVLKLLNDPELLKLDKSFKSILGIKGVGSKSPLRFEMDTGILTVVLPGKMEDYLEEKLGQVARLAALRYPIFGVLQIEGEDPKFPEGGFVFFRAQMDDYYQKIIAGKTCYYKPFPEKKPEVLQTDVVRERLMAFSKEIDGRPERQKIQNDFYLLYLKCRRALAIQAAVEFSQGGLEKETGGEIEKYIIEAWRERGILGLADLTGDSPAALTPNRYLVAKACLDLFEEELRQKKDSKLNPEETKRLKSLMSFILGPTLTALYREPEIKMISRE